MQSKAVGVDDQPMWHGLGRMIILTEPGEHLVEVRGRSSAETVRLVRVRAGEIAELEYWMPASPGLVDGVLVPAPARRRLGSGLLGIVASYLALAGIILLAAAAGLRPTVAFVAALFVAAIAATVLTVRVKRGMDRRFRAAVSYEAEAEADGRRAAEAGMFLGDGAAPPGLAGSNRGILVVTATAAREYLWNGTRVAAKPAADPNSWLPWPTLTIDGTTRPFSWRTWCYRLPPGQHQVTVAVRPPLAGPAADGHRFGAEPVSVKVEIAAGRVTRLDLRVKATVEVRSTARDRDAPTELTRFEATVDAKTSTPVTPAK